MSFPKAGAEGRQGDGRRAGGGGGAVPGSAGTSTGLCDFAGQYSLALQEYCAEGGEGALFRAYELGRRAAREGLGVLEMVAVHHEALAAALLEADAVDESTRIAQRASELFAECLAPFEMRRRVYQEEHARLRALKQGLEQRLDAALHNLEAAPDQLRTPVTSIHGSLSLLQGGCARS